MKSPRQQGKMNRGTVRQEAVTQAPLFAVSGCSKATGGSRSGTASVAGEQAVGGVVRNAALSPCGKYRWALSRWWAPGPTALFIMLNPSTADAERDDPTLRRCIGFARAWGCGSLFVGNLFSYRATDPRELRRCAAPVGSKTDDVLEWMAQQASIIVAGWGGNGSLMGRSGVVLRMFRELERDLHCLGVNRNGTPKHPLYLPGDSRPRIWRRG